MERLSDNAIDIINQLHTERLAYNSEYIPLIDCANRLSEYEDTGLTVEEIVSLKAENATLRKKLDMAIKDLQGDCFACANGDECKKYPCYCLEGSAFKWRGEDGAK